MVNTSIPVKNTSGSFLDPGLDLNLLAIFDAVFSDRSISNAAKRLELAQPTVSNALNRLRRITADQLFVRTSRGMEPTPHAERIAQPVRQVLAVLRSTLNAPREFDPVTAERTFTLFLTDLGEAFFLPRLLNRVRTQAPGVKLLTLPIPEHNPQAALENGEVDIAIGNLPSLTTGFYQQRLFREHYICIARADHPLFEGEMTLEKFGRASHAVVLPLGTGHGIVEQTMHKLGFHKQIMLRLQNFVVLPTVVAHTDLVAIVPHSIADELSTNHPLKLMTPPFALPDFDIKQCWHKRFHSDAGNQWLRQQIAQLFMREQTSLETPID